MQNDIRTLVDDFTTQLQRMIRRTALEQVQAALGGDISAPRRGPGRPAKAAPIRRAAKGGKRDAASLDEMGGEILAFVKSNPGQGAIEIAKALKTDVGTIRLPMQNLLAERKVNTKGQRRGTKYFAAGGGDAGPAKPKAAVKSKRKTGKRGSKKTSPAGPKSLVVEVAAAA